MGKPEEPEPKSTNQTWHAPATINPHIAPISPGYGQNLLV